MTPPKKMDENLISMIVIIWMVCISGSLVAFSNNNLDVTFYKFGPNENLVVLGIKIDTPAKYGLVIIYSLLNNIVRNLNSNILRSWITHNIQDDTVEGVIRKKTLNYALAYQINTVFTIYQWFDWLIYIHLLLSQFDLFLIESSSDVLIVTIIVRYWYLPPTPTSNGYSVVPGLATNNGVFSEDLSLIV
jgi:hypothetical protein